MQKPSIIAAPRPTAEEAEIAVKTLLAHIGEDVEREGVLDTPARVVKAWKQLTRGYAEDPAQILSTTFGQDDFDGVSQYGGMVLLRDIDFCSLCEHHCLSFTGKAHVAYIPGASGRIVGLSKLARLVDCFARRLQVQERLTSQIADALEKHLEPAGAMVVIQATHDCMRTRGVEKQHSVMVTSEVRGAFQSNADARAEALSLIKN